MKRLILLFAVALCVACGPDITSREMISDPYKEEATTSCYTTGYCYKMGKYKFSTMCPGRRDGIATYQVERVYYEDGTDRDFVRRIDFEGTGSCK